MVRLNFGLNKCGGFGGVLVYFVDFTLTLNSLFQCIAHCFQQCVRSEVVKIFSKYSKQLTLDLCPVMCTSACSYKRGVV